MAFLVFVPPVSVPVNVAVLTNHTYYELGMHVLGFQNIMPLVHFIPYILESNPHPFYSFRGLKNQMRIRIECGLDSQSRAGFWKNDRAGVRDITTIQLFIILFIILYNILKYL
jgi:hypothetical protein